ncbi:MAG: hypothetical protein ABI135_00800 [Rhodoferax sp.]
MKRRDILITSMIALAGAAQAQVGNARGQLGPFVQSEIKHRAQVVKHSGAQPE